MRAFARRKMRFGGGWEYTGIPATGQAIRVEGMNFYRLRDDRVTDIWSQFDGVGMIQ